VLGLYWRKANACGALASMACGVGLFMLLSITKWPVLGLHPIVPTLAFSGLAFAAGQRLGRPANPAVVQLFWGD
jgi:sodium/pantothenate symporter